MITVSTKEDKEHRRVHITKEQVVLVIGVIMTVIGTVSALVAGWLFAFNLFPEDANLAGVAFTSVGVGVVGGFLWGFGYSES